MLISKKWLQTYFAQELPSTQKIADTLLLHSFEVEDVYEIDNDWIIDIDVLPNRAHDCLSYKGVAMELAPLLDISLKEQRYSPYSDMKLGAESLSIHLENKEQCRRYVATRVENIEIRETPPWLKNRLHAMGQKSINALVDATNYVLFDLGQPMHVFDADKLVGDIIVRNARAGETMITLSGEEIELQETDLLICDDKAILALAGVKGGSHAEVTATTKNIIIESANFHPLSTRKTARRVKILTDSSKRFENEITAEKAMEGMEAMLSLVLELASTDQTQRSEITDEYPIRETQHELVFSYRQVCDVLGMEISDQDINDVLEKFSYQYYIQNDSCYVTIPFERIDLRIAQDMIEEIGRLYGYDKIPARSLDEFDFQPEQNQQFYVVQKLKNYFIEHGFLEVMNYSFVNKGNVEVYNPVASDKKALRKNLSTQMKDSLQKNARSADFMGLQQLLNFEIDVIHSKTGEELWCCFGIDALSKKMRKEHGTEQVQIERHIDAIAQLFGHTALDHEKDANIVSFRVDQLQDKMEADYANLFDIRSYATDAEFSGISVYPYIKRDISFWTIIDNVETFEKAFFDAGTEFLQKVFLFDEFEKDGKTSYAFSLIFQSFEKTLTDAEVEKDMEKINKAVIDLGGEIR